MIKEREEKENEKKTDDTALLANKVKISHVKKAVEGLRRIMLLVDVMAVNLGKATIGKHNDKTGVGSAGGECDYSGDFDYFDSDDFENDDDNIDDEHNIDDEDRKYNNTGREIPWRYWSDDLVYDGSEESLKDKSLWMYNYTAKLDRLNRVPIAAVPLMVINRYVSHAKTQGGGSDVFFEKEVWDRMKTNLLRHAWDDTSHRTTVLIIGCLVALLYSLNIDDARQPADEYNPSELSTSSSSSHTNADEWLCGELVKANLYDCNIGDLFPGFIIHILHKWTSSNDCINTQRNMINRYHRESASVGSQPGELSRLRDEIVSLRKYTEIGLNNMSNTSRLYQNGHRNQLPDFFRSYSTRMIYPIVYPITK